MILHNTTDIKSSDKPLNDRDILHYRLALEEEKRVFRLEKEKQSLQEEKEKFEEYKRQFQLGLQMERYCMDKKSFYLATHCIKMDFLDIQQYKTCLENGLNEPLKPGFYAIISYSLITKVS